jgi:hypothetical protein
MRPRSGKTSLAIAKLSKADPEESSGYFTYADGTAKAKGRGLHANVVLGKVGCSLAGQVLDGTVIVDDPTRNMQEAKDAALVEETIGWILNVLIPRCSISSRIVIMGTAFTGSCVMARLAKDPPPGFTVETGS